MPNVYGTTPTTIVGDFNIGQEILVSFSNPTIGTFPAQSLGLVMKFTATANDKLLEVDAISNNGIPVYKGIPRGWKGKISWARNGGALTNVYMQQAQNFWNGVGAQTLWTMNVRVFNDDGTVDSYAFLGVTLYNLDFGDFEANKEVGQSLEFMAQQLVPA